MAKLLLGVLSVLISVMGLSPTPVVANDKPQGRVTLSDDQLLIDGKAQGFLFGAELQYFRARGGAQRNVPREKVLALWTKLLDRFQEAHMNTAIFYIPWDFHEPVEGTFDFTGTLDQDGDGRPDYPSRDLITFINMLQARGIKRIMVRPGPYINAEWGATGFGAIPKWFLDNYPETLTGSTSPGRALTVSYAHPLYRERVKRWFKALHEQVLQHYIGGSGPVVMLQIDNETNYFWDSVYERDYSPLSVSRYRSFLQTTYHNSLAALNQAYAASFTSFAQVEPPKAANDLRFSQAWHYDWFSFHDEEIRAYYRFLKDTWRTLGVTDAQVLMTSCDSFNASQDGLLPRLDFRQQDQLTLTTMNIYPKTYGTLAESTMNTPMKAAHDATLVSASHRQFYGTAGHWLMSSETVGGWFPPTEVNLATRQHTYGSLIGSGVKAMTIYYFHEGWNWDGREINDSELHFQAPLDKDMNPQPAYELIKNLGDALEKGLGDMIMHSRPLRAPILIAHDSASQYPLPNARGVIDAASTESAGLFGLFREAGALPDVAYADHMSPSELATYRLVVWRYEGAASPAMLERLTAYLKNKGHVLVVGNNLPPSWVGMPGVWHWASDVGRAWNSDLYGRLPHAKESLQAAADILQQANITPLTRLVSDDGQAYGHAWLRYNTKAKTSLLFVENFIRTERQVTVKIDAAALPPGEKFRLRPWFAAHIPSRAPQAQLLRRNSLVKEGLRLTIDPDAIGIWSLEAVPVPAQRK